jgi:hypothetical protein
MLRLIQRSCAHPSFAFGSTLLAGVVELCALSRVAMVTALRPARKTHTAAVKPPSPTARRSSSGPSATR